MGFLATARRSDDDISDGGDERKVVIRHTDGVITERGIEADISPDDPLIRVRTAQGLAGRFDIRGEQRSRTAAAV